MMGRRRWSLKQPIVPAGVGDVGAGVVGTSTSMGGGIVTVGVGSGVRSVSSNFGEAPGVEKDVGAALAAMAGEGVWRHDPRGSYKCPKSPPEYSYYIHHNIKKTVRTRKRKREQERDPTLELVAIGISCVPFLFTQHPTCSGATKMYYGKRMTRRRCGNPDLCDALISCCKEESGVKMRSGKERHNPETGRSLLQYVDHQQCYALFPCPGASHEHPCRQLRLGAVNDLSTVYIHDKHPGNKRDWCFVTPSGCSRPRTAVPRTGKGVCCQAFGDKTFLYSPFSVVSVSKTRLCTSALLQVILGTWPSQCNYRYFHCSRQPRGHFQYMHGVFITKSAPVSPRYSPPSKESGWLGEKKSTPRSKRKSRAQRAAADPQARVRFSQCRPCEALYEA